MIDYDALFNGLDEIDFSPERRLMVAILVRAILDSRGEFGAVLEKRSGFAMAEAQHWIFTETPDPECLVSFKWICDILGFCPDTVRSRILKLPYAKSTKQHLYKQGGVRIHEQPNNMGTQIRNRSKTKFY